MKKSISLTIMIFCLCSIYAAPNNPEDKSGVLQAHLYVYQMNLQRFNTDMKDISFSALTGTYAIIIGILKNDYHQGYLNEKTLTEFYGKRAKFLEDRFTALEHQLEVAYWKMMYLDSVNHQEELAIAKEEIQKYLTNEIKVLTTK